MKQLTWVLLLFVFSLLPGCGSSSGPAPVTAEDQAQIEANDAAVDEAEKAQATGEAAK